MSPSVTVDDGSYPANFMAVAGVSTHHLHEGFAVALNDSKVLSLQFGETIFWGCETLPHCLPCCEDEEADFHRWPRENLNIVYLK